MVDFDDCNLVVGYGETGDVTVFDFAGVARPDPADLEPLSDARAAAIFYSNDEEKSFAAAYIKKPFGNQELLEVIQRL